jgi:hypothetical protein
MCGRQDAVAAFDDLTSLVNHAELASSCRITLLFLRAHTTAIAYRTRERIFSLSQNR